VPSAKSRSFGAAKVRGIVASLRHATLDAAANLFPGYFAIVMATGAVSIACELLGLGAIAWPLFACNVVFYGALWLLTLLRAVCFPRRIVADLVDHARGPGFFTLVAGTCVFGTQLVVVAHDRAAAAILLTVGIALWIVIMYAFFIAVTIRREKPDLQTGINGAWLLAAVATQSTSVLGTLLASDFAQPKIVLFAAVCMYFLGCLLYLSIITLIFYRLTFIRLTTVELTPPYWINMGAVAITTLAGSTLILNAGGSPLLVEILPFLKGFTLFFWTAATWWIPLLLALTVWRHAVKRHPLRYEPQLWGMVFPLGMYTTGTLRLAQALDLPFLLAIPTGFIAIALLVWSMTAIGLVHSLWREFRALPPLHAVPPAGR
jgi:tellurite resistance protein TehA-like permease